MPSRSNKWMAEIVTPSISSPVDIATKVYRPSCYSSNDNVDGTFLAIEFKVKVITIFSNL
jgi:hypothetical protein